MKDIVIKGTSIKRELWVLLGCFIAAYGLNIYSILHWHRPATELFMTIGYVIVFTVGIYVALWIVRLVVLLIKSIFFKKKNK